MKTIRLAGWSWAGCSFIIAMIAVAGCAATSSTTGGASSPTSKSLDAILAGDQRSAENRARDIYRHPKDTLLFFGMRPDMKVVEVWPGSGGWYTEIIAPLVNEKGKYYGAFMPADPKSKYITDAYAAYKAKLQSRPDLYGKVEMVELGPNTTDIAPPGTIDMVVTFRNMHNWMARDWAPKAYEAMFRALKPGGVLGVEEHRGNPALPQDPQAKSGYVNEDYAIKVIEAAGFKLVAKSEVNANPQDTKDYEQGVWTLPPTYRLGDKDREKYAAIGESDRFTLKFVKPKK
jgi:predicted methyltransferase